MKESEIITRILTMSDGRQVMLQETPMLSVTVEADDATIVSEQTVILTESKRDDLLKKLPNNNVWYSESSGKLTFTPRKKAK